MSKVATDDGARPEALDGAVQGLVPVPERLRALAVRRVLVHRADEQVAHRRRRHERRRPDLPVCRAPNIESAQLPPQSKRPARTGLCVRVAV